MATIDEQPIEPAKAQVPSQRRPFCWKSCAVGILIAAVWLNLLWGLVWVTYGPQ